VSLCSASVGARTPSGCNTTADLTLLQCNYWCRHGLCRIVLSRSKNITCPSSAWGKEWNFTHPNSERLSCKHTWLAKQHAAANLNLLSVHDCLAKRLYRVGLWPLPYCTLCGQRAEMDERHLLKYTALYSTPASQRYWETKGRMSGWCCQHSCHLNEWMNEKLIN
jgi:hypothetical protein